MSSDGAAPRAAGTVSSARAEASRTNGARSRGPKTPEGKARSAQNALKHGMRAQKHVLLPDEDAAEFATLEAALLIEELQPVGALQTVLAQRGAVATFRLARADRLAAETGLGPVPQLGGQQTELFEERQVAQGALGLALIRDGNGARSFETVGGASTDLGGRCASPNGDRGAAMAEFWRAPRTLKALQAEQAAATDLRMAAPATVRAQPLRPAARPEIAIAPHQTNPSATPSLHRSLRLRVCAARPARPRRHAARAFGALDAERTLTSPISARMMMACMGMRRAWPLRRIRPSVPTSRRGSPTGAQDCGCRGPAPGR